MDYDVLGEQGNARRRRGKNGNVSVNPLKDIRPSYEMLGVEATMIFPLGAGVLGGIYVDFVLDAEIGSCCDRTDGKEKAYLRARFRATMGLYGGIKKPSWGPRKRIKVGLVGNCPDLGDRNKWLFEGIVRLNVSVGPVSVNCQGPPDSVKCRLEWELFPKKWEASIKAGGGIQGTYYIIQ